MTDAGLLAFRRLLRGPLPLVCPGAPARGVRPPLLRPAVLRGLLHVQPVSRQARGPSPAPAGRVVSPPAGVPGRRKIRAELLDQTTCVPVCACTCVCACTWVCVCVHPRAHRHTLGGEEAWSQDRAPQPARPEPRSSGKAGRPGIRKTCRRSASKDWPSCHLETTASGGGVSPSRLRPLCPAPAAVSLHRDPRWPRAGELVSILVGSLASGNGK